LVSQDSVLVGGGESICETFAALCALCGEKAFKTINREERRERKESRKELNVGHYLVETTQECLGAPTANLDYEDPGSALSLINECVKKPRVDMKFSPAGEVSPLRAGRGATFSRPQLTNPENCAGCGSQI
jgi:hypothetical protein